MSTISMRRVAFRTVHVLLLALLATSAWGLSEEFRQTYELAADGRISLENVNGDVVVESWDRADVEVSYVKKSKTQRGFDRIQVEIEERAGGLDISTEYRRLDDENGWNDGGSVDFTLYVPRQARIDGLELVNGDLKLHRLEGEISVEVVNGDIFAEGLAGQVEIASVNGTVEVGFETLSAGQKVELESVNGTLMVALPSDADADVKAETVHGGIENDFGFEVEKGRYVGRSMHGTLGNGSAQVELENVNGTIKVVGR